MNTIPADYPPWLAGALDHTADAGGDGSSGYMMLIGAGATPGDVFRTQMGNLVAGSRYEFSAYVANVVQSGNNLIRPSVRFEVRTTSADNTLLASTTTGNIGEYGTLTWNQYGMSFYAPSSSVVLVMVSVAPGGGGNDFVVDDITLRTCASTTSASCSARKSSADLVRQGIIVLR